MAFSLGVSQLFLKAPKCTINVALCPAGFGYGLGSVFLCSFHSQVGRLSWLQGRATSAFEQLPFRRNSPGHVSFPNRAWLRHIVWTCPMIRCGLTASAAHSAMLDHTTSLADNVYWHERRIHPDTSRITSHKWFKMRIVGSQVHKTIIRNQQPWLRNNNKHTPLIAPCKQK